MLIGVHRQRQCSAAGLRNFLKFSLRLAIYLLDSEGIGKAIAKKFKKFSFMIPTTRPKLRT